jgi:hypothetical protein
MAMSCRDMEIVAGCLIAPPALPVPVLIHYEYQEAASGQVIVHAIRYTDAAGAIVAVPAGGTVVAGQCPMVKTEVEDQLLCDDADVNPATPAIPFLRRFTRVYNTADGSLISQTVANFKIDGTTPYAVSAEANVSTNCTSGYAFTEITVCDSNGTPMIRRQAVVNGASVLLGFFDPTTAAVVVPVGAVGPCPSCGPSTALGVVSTWG